MALVPQGGMPPIGGGRRRLPIRMPLRPGLPPRFPGLPGAGGGGGNRGGGSGGSFRIPHRGGGLPHPQGGNPPVYPGAGRPPHELPPPLPAPGGGLPPAGGPPIRTGPILQPGYNRGANVRHGFDDALDFAGSHGFNDAQYAHLLQGQLPGGFHGAFRGMTPDQLKEVASFTAAQGVAGQGGPIDPITGQPTAGPMMHAYTDQRTANSDDPWEAGYQPPKPILAPPGTGRGNLKGVLAQMGSARPRSFRAALMQRALGR